MCIVPFRIETQQLTTIKPDSFKMIMNVNYTTENKGISHNLKVLLITVLYDNMTNVLNF